jgi:hypothetical protein
MKKSSIFQFILLVIFFVSTHTLFSQITDTGDKVGIGVPVPKEKLSLPLNAELGFAYSSGQPSQVRIKGGSTGMLLTSAYTTTQTAQSFAFFTMNSTPSEIQRLTLLNNGKMGFNTIFAPQERITLPWEEEIGFSHASGANSQIRIKGGATGMRFTSATTVTQTSKAFAFYAMNSSGAEAERITILNNGNTGIGTTLANNPNDYKLAVNGKIGAKEVQVENTSSTWADYVFESDYKLMPLKLVEDFVNTNKHLPEIPSAEEVKINGHKLGEMDVLLLKKIEELTLYIIEQDKKIERLEKAFTDGSK